MRFFRPVPRVSLAKPAEAAELAELYRRVWGGLEGLAEPARAELTATSEEVQAWMRGGFEVYRASLDGRLVGAVRCCFPVSTCYIDQLVVEPGQGGHGFGRYLVEHVISRARRAGVTRVWARCSPRWEGAVGLLRDLDFMIVSRLVERVGGEEVLLLELSL